MMPPSPLVLILRRRLSGHGRLPVVLLTGLLCLGVASCATDPIGRTVPVEGKVTVNGEALKQGSVVFWPDADRGNDSPFEAAAKISEDGRYKLLTRGRTGARPGAYKVTVMAEVPSNPKDIYSRPRLLVPQVYTTKESTPLTVEVVDNPVPDAYDLAVR